MASTDQHSEELRLTFQEVLPNRDFTIGSPDYDQFIKPWAINLNKRDEEIFDIILNNNSLIKVLNSDDPDPEQVDNLLSNYNVERKQGSPLQGYVAIYFKGATTILINSTAVITCSDQTLSPTKSYIGYVGDAPAKTTNDIEYVPAVPVGDNLYVFSIEVIGSEPTDTVLGIGQECSIDVNNNFITSVKVSSTMDGGVLPETTAELLERSTLGITAPAVSGKDHIRSLLENSDLGVIDSAVFGMGDIEVLRDMDNPASISTGGKVDAYVSTSPTLSKLIVPLVGTQDGSGNWVIEIPSTYAGVYFVPRVSRADVLIDDVSLQLGFIPTENRPYVNTPEHARYSVYQTAQAEFYYQTDSLELTFDVEILYMPGLGDIQEFVEDEARQSADFDTLIKGSIPLEVKADILIQYPMGVVPPSVESIQSAVADAINGKRMGTAVLPSSVLVSACDAAFEGGEVQMPINMNGIIYDVAGKARYSADNNNISVPETISGLTYRNTKFFCDPADIGITLREIAK